MTNFETLDNLNTNFVTLSENELIEVDGGIASAIIYGGAVAGGLLLGWLLG